jgi:two-component system, LuxR family, response regulator FixJ
MAEATIHIVDDDAAVRDSLRLLLETSGFATVAYESGDAFLATMPARPQGCLVIDVRMPGRGGVEVQEELGARGVKLPVIVMTGHADVPLAVRAMKAGAVDFVEKPFGDQLIIAAIRRALELGASAREQDAAAAGIAQRLALLTQRERQVLDALVQGHPNKVIAYELSISPRTVEIHRSRVMDKMQARSLSELVRMALAADPLPPPQR